MINPTFARTRHVYDSYKDFWQLVELAGFNTCYVDEINHADDNATYIIPMLNGEWVDGYPDTRARLIWWDLEWRVNDRYIPAGVSEIWVSDKWYAEHIGARYVLLGSDARLAGGALHAVPQYDYALMSYMTGRRMHLNGALAQHNLIGAPNGWDGERDSILRSSRVMIHCHQHDDIHTVAPQRFALASAYGLPLITETCSDIGLLYGTVLSADFPHLADFTKVMLTRHADILKEHGAILHEHLCVTHPFKKCVLEALGI